MVFSEISTELGGSASSTAMVDSDSPKTLLPGLDELWQETEGDSEIRIAVLDGPVDLSHPCFDGADLKSLPTLVAQDGRSDHGTHVASLIFGRRNSRAPGVAPGCGGLILPVFQQTEQRTLRPCTQQDLARNISLALEAGAHIINISGGELSSSGRGIDFLENAVRQAAERNVLIIAATGNEGCECLHVPAALPNVLPVGALDRDGRPLGTSNWSTDLKGIMAPGAMIRGALPNGETGWMTGTSFATPLVAGVAGLLLSLQKKHGLKPDPAAVRRALLDSVTPCDADHVTDCRRWLQGVLSIRGARRRLGLDGVTLSQFHVSSQSSPKPMKGEHMSENMEPGAKAQGSNVQPSEEGIKPSCCGSPTDGGAVQPSDGRAPLAKPATVGVEPAASPPAPSPVSAPAAGSGAVAGVASGRVEPSATSSVALSAGATSSGATSAGGALMSHSAIGNVAPSCEGGSMFSPFPSGQKAFTIGKLYYDSGTEARRD